MTRFYSLTGAIFLIVATATGTTVFADDYESRLAVATEYSNMAADDLDMNTLIDRMLKPWVQGYELSGKKFSDAQLGELRALYLKRFSEPILEMVRNQGPIMAEIFTLAELDALLAFYKTPEGRAVMSKLPTLLEKQQPEMMNLVAGNMGPIMQSMQEIFQ